MQNIKRRNRRIERHLTRSYIEELSEAYNNYFFKYSDSPLLIVNSSDIDFIKNENEFDELFKQIFREDRGINEYYNPEAKGGVLG
jgi:deoxyadenosine/deoxycytidine kinase